MGKAKNRLNDDHDLSLELPSLTVGLLTQSGGSELKVNSMKRIFLLVLFGFVVGLSAAAQGPKPPQKHQIVTAAQANGVYRYYQSEFRILALGHNKLKVQFDGIYMTVSRSPNMGYASGEATIAGNVATFVPADTQGCKISMTFLPG